MGITENAAYLKGLAEGMKLDEGTNEGKLIAKMLELIGEMAEKIDMLESASDELYTYMEGMAEDLVNLENDFYEDGECEEEDYSDLNEDYEDEDLIVISADRVFRFQIAFQMIAKRLIAFGRAVLQNVDRAIFEQTRGDFGDRFHRERFGSGVARRQRHDTGNTRIFQNFTDCGRLQVAQTVGKGIFHQKNASKREKITELPLYFTIHD